MTESRTTQSKPTLFQTATSDSYQRWRLVKDKLAARGVVVGGLSIIVAVVLIFFYLLYVVFPLLLPAKLEVAGNAGYGVPAAEMGKTLFAAVEEQNQMAVRFTDAGKAVFFYLAGGEIVANQALPVPETSQITSFAHGSIDNGVVAYGLTDGKVLVAKHEYKLSYPDGKRLITPSISYPLGNQALTIDKSGQPLLKIALAVAEDRSTLVAKTADNRLLLSRLSKKESMFDDEVTWEASDTLLEVAGDDVEYMLVDKQQRNLYLASRQSITVVDVSDAAAPAVKHKLNLVENDSQINSLAFLNGENSLLVGDSKGELAQWSLVRNDQNYVNMQKLRSFKLADNPIVALSAEQRRRGMLAIDSGGQLAVYNSTAERELINTKLLQGAPQVLALSPKADLFLVEDANGKILTWHLQNEHPEISLKSLWRKVWYESYPKPDYIWQSSSASNDFEPKMSLTPLVFGTLKASFYAMLMGIPLALFGAIYTGYFMAPRVRQYVKPGIEIMGALPTVILGFLAGLWLAPFVESHLAGIFAMLMVVPLSVMIFAYLWQQVPEPTRHKIPDGWDAIVLVPVVAFGAWLAFELAPSFEAWFFNGDLRVWMREEFGIGYDQRNTLVVGLAMGFAVIPMIFSIAEDAIFSVPKHLTTGSLALGATPWQTMTKVVLLTASPGIFSAVMIGFGRAVGETMIVLMATGNTPVMDLSIFQGLRTLSANIAVEMPESEVNSTHYRVLFLAALVLFVFTFVVNTLAELVRQNLRQKYSSL
ncbi:ABC transporter permease subunit [Methylomonas sp. SURF-1]|uniref:ABC transporter permease subunit n=1 Tax=Methylomonas aurea TaxID=2952224 RepID=A0ABT1UC59_9GAMM|nr:ABC transporter permease subunit [Methylomonas sp. SURF-1]MCQ8179820.1 ABC transporter permease subunit [Methylomonas sp. SURF-1]